MTDIDLAVMELDWKLDWLDRLSGYQSVENVDGVAAVEDARDLLAGVKADLEEAEDGGE